MTSFDKFTSADNALQMILAVRKPCMPGVTPSRNRAISLADPARTAVKR